VWHQHLALAYFDIGDYKNFMLYADTALKVLGYPCFFEKNDTVFGSDDAIAGDSGKWVFWKLSVQRHLPLLFGPNRRPEVKTVAACLLYEKYTQLCMEYNVSLKHIASALRQVGQSQLILLIKSSTAQQLYMHHHRRHRHHDCHHHRHLHHQHQYSQRLYVHNTTGPSLTSGPPLTFEPLLSRPTHHILPSHPIPLPSHPPPHHILRQLHTLTVSDNIEVLARTHAASGLMWDLVGKPRKVNFHIALPNQ
jgi:hypothetical protein